MQRSILIVEDDPTSRITLAKLLTLQGFKIITARTLDEAVLKLKDNPGCILLDLLLPDGCGTELLRQICRDPGGPRVAVTSTTIDRELLREASELGATVFRKPLWMPSLMDWLKQCAEGDSHAGFDDDSNADEDGRIRAGG